MEYPAKQSNYWDRRGDIIVYGRGGKGKESEGGRVHKTKRMQCMHARESELLPVIDCWMVSLVINVTMMIKSRCI